MNFRNISGTTINLGIDIGPISNFTQPGNSFAVPGLTDTTLTGVYGGAGGLKWSVAGYFDDANNLTTLVMSVPLDGGVPTRRSDAALNQTLTRIDTVGNAYRDLGQPVAGNTLAVTLGDVTTGYSKIQGVAGKWQGTFQENTEVLNPVPFASSAKAELYLLPATEINAAGVDATQAKALGVFEVAPNGHVTFTPSTVPEPSAITVLGLGALAVSLVRSRSAVRSGN